MQNAGCDMSGAQTSGPSGYWSNVSAMQITIVLKLGSVIDSVRVLGHWVNGRTTESLVEPHDWIGLNRITRLDDSVLRLIFL